MPQMSPMWWEMLFIYFMMLFLIMNSIIFWSINMKNKSNFKNLEKNKEMNWKW
uniref:ATP synthase F0 subunit 8 n=1 Tax=Cymoninus sechellensis TaxID=3103804 RepID=UPI002E75F129|nr:ATP synthase F0 subunit 8 [Cymoninus sechellensis]WPW49238.1 ATP synthase F0 subunit 8 [Cymoninus sechellensis]